MFNLANGTRALILIAVFSVAFYGTKSLDNEKKMKKSGGGLGGSEL